MAQQTKAERVNNGEIIESDAGKKTGAVLVVGGGIAGIQASLDLADGGYKVYMVEKSTAIGGHSFPPKKASGRKQVPPPF